MEKLIIGDDIGYYADWSSADLVDLLQAAAGGIPKAVEEAKRRGVFDEIRTNA